MIVSATDRPTASGFGHPKMVSAIGFQSVMMPFASIVTTASSALSKMLLSRLR
jgi:hypothetical protein